MGLRSALLASVLWGGFASATPPSPERPNVDIHTEDVDLFYKVYESAGGGPTAAQLQRDYIDRGTDGLRTFLRLRGTTATTLAEAIAEQPQLYDHARSCVSVLPRARDRLSTALMKLRELYPKATFPPVTVAIGRGRPIGVGSPDSGLQIGLEALCGVTYSDADPQDRFVHIVAHEYIHVQQPREVVDDQNPTVLEGSLVEGTAEFLGELVSGGVSFAQQNSELHGREAEIDSQFMADKESRDVSKWLYNGSMTRAGNIGYWVGYRIVRSYYERAKDKHLAIGEIVEMRDPEAFLAKSGWRPGVGYASRSAATYPSTHSSSETPRRASLP